MHGCRSTSGTPDQAREVGRPPLVVRPHAHLRLGLGQPQEAELPHRAQRPRRGLGPSVRGSAAGHRDHRDDRHGSPRQGCRDIRGQRRRDPRCFNEAGHQLELISSVDQPSEESDENISSADDEGITDEIENDGELSSEEIENNDELISEEIESNVTEETDNHFQNKKNDQLDRMKQDIDQNILPG